MGKITITGCGEFDGDYNLDLNDRPFNGDELHLIKLISGVRLGEIPEAGAAGDYDLFVAMAVLALVRTGNASLERAVEVSKILLRGEAGAIQYIEDDPVPPVEASPSEPKPSDASEPTTVPSFNGSANIGDETPATIHTSTGHPG